MNHNSHIYDSCSIHLNGQVFFIYFMSFNSQDHSIIYSIYPFYISHGFGFTECRHNFKTVGKISPNHYYSLKSGVLFHIDKVSAVTKTKITLGNKEKLNLI